VSDENPETAILSHEEIYRAIARQDFLPSQEIGSPGPGVKSAIRKWPDSPRARCPEPLLAANNPSF